MKSKNMKWRPVLLIAVVAMISVVYITYAANTAGTTADPLVTVSYLEKKLDEKLNEKFEEILGEMIDAKIAEMIKDALAELNDVSVGEILKFTPAFEKAGTVVLLGEGTEIIIRTGAATALSPHTDIGLVDATAGEDVQDGTALRYNHVYIGPRNDGRGFVITKDCHFMVKGEYTAN